MPFPTASGTNGLPRTACTTLLHSKVLRHYGSSVVARCQVVLIAALQLCMALTIDEPLLFRFPESRSYTSDYTGYPRVICTVHVTIVTVTTQTGIYITGKPQTKIYITGKPQTKINITGYNAHWNIHNRKYHRSKLKNID